MITTVVFRLGKRRRTRLSLTFSLSLVALAACASSDTGPTDAMIETRPFGDTLDARPTTLWTLRRDGTEIQVTDFGATLAGSSADLSLRVENFALSDDYDAAPVEGAGHYHIYLDGAFFDGASRSRRRRRPNSQVAGHEAAKDALERLLPVLEDSERALETVRSWSRGILKDAVDRRFGRDRLVSTHGWE